MAAEPRATSPWIDEVPDVGRYPKLEGDADCDVVVIGGGISGAMTAWNLARKGMSAIILEKNRIASGDTAYTTGFLLRIPDTSIGKLVELYGAAAVKQVFEAAGEAQDSLRSIIRENGIRCGFSDCPAYYCSAAKADGTLREEWEAIREACPGTSFTRKKLGAGMKEAVEFDGEGQFNPRAFIFGLLGSPPSRSIRVFEDSEALEVAVGEGVTVKTASGSVRAKKAVVCSGLPIAAFAGIRKLVQPKVTYAIAARYPGKPPIAKALFWDTSDPYFYFRRLDERTVILGGSDRRPGEKSDGKDPHEALSDFLGERMGSGAEITNAWSGTVFESPDGLPFASEHPAYEGRVFVCCGFGGNGLVMGALAGSIAADLASGTANRHSALFSFARVKADIRAPEKAAEGGRTTFRVRIAEVGEGAPRRIDAGGRPIAVFKAGNGYFAIDDTCTHAGGSLCDGSQDGTVVTCPNHGARFDVRDGRVVGPPATRPLRSYPVKEEGGELVVDASPASGASGGPVPGGAGAPAHDPGASSARPKPAKGPGLFEGARADMGYVLRASALALLFWAAQFFYMYFSAVSGQLDRSIILASSYTGATLIGIALIIGPVAALFPRLNYVQHRRAFGVWGFTFIIAHVAWVLMFYHFTIQTFLSDLDPFTNAIIFGALAFACFLPMYLTSTDWAVSRLGFRHWKTIHRIVYLAFLFATLHFIRITYLNNTTLIWNWSKAVLMAVASVAYIVELSAYAKHMGRKRTWWNTIYGGALILFGAAALYVALTLPP
jgi:glycine/D-amino acid oxidase-like deaminating enzyme/nitrite reductase/ring-hydroxylating ferredoxin subunit/DMSO/TMAO reductase YedYZ heme-binding membrane subunit